jgi:hypothetical protein
MQGPWFLAFIINALSSVLTSARAYRDGDGDARTQKPEFQSQNLAG